MKMLAKTLTGAAAAALVALTAAAPAQAQSYPYPYPDNGPVIDAGAIARGVAVAGAAAAAVGAITNVVRGSVYGATGGYGYPQSTYGYPQASYGYGSGYGEQRAVDACAYQAQRYGGRVAVTDVDRRGSTSYRVRGTIEPQFDRPVARGYERHDDYRERRTFSCSAREDGRVTDFDSDRR